MELGSLVQMIVVTPIAIKVNFIAIWKNKYFLIRVSWLEYPHLSASPHSLSSILQVFEQWAGRCPNEGIKAGIFSGPPVIQ
jgi:hypothetical protein